MAIRLPRKALTRCGVAVPRSSPIKASRSVTFSDLPLRIASWLGLSAFLIGMIWLAIIIIAKIIGDITVSGFASVMAGIVLFGGIQLLILGIIGEYLGRVNFKTSRRPLYLVARDTKLPSRKI